MNTKQTQAAFTAGPWTSDDDGDSFITVRDAEGEFVTRLAKSRYHDDRADPECDANNALMIAAPALYEAAEEALDWIEAEIRSRAHDIEADDPPLARLRAALRQARGEA